MRAFFPQRTALLRPAPAPASGLRKVPHAPLLGLLLAACCSFAAGCESDAGVPDGENESPAKAPRDDRHDGPMDERDGGKHDHVIDAGRVPGAGGRIDAAASRDAGAEAEPRSDGRSPEPAQGDAAEPAATPGGDGGSASPRGPLPPASDFSKDGPYKSTTLQNSGPDGKYTVYLPAELGVGGVKHPIVGWMSGGGTTHTGYSLLPRLATHGFVVVAANVTPGIGQEVALGKQIIAGLDWAIAESGKADSKLFGKLAADKIASMGYSMGSLATFTIANDPRLTTTVHISGGNMDPSRVNNLHAPAAFICGNPGAASCSILSSECDIAGANCETDFKNAKTPVFYAKFNGGHLGILMSPLADRIGTLATTWLRWKLMNDSALDAMFVGEQCTFCKDATWKVQKKNLP